MKTNNKTEKVSFKQAFIDYWKGYVDFQGRTTRAGYWWMQLTFFLSGLVFIVIIFSQVAISDSINDNYETDIAIMVFLAVILLTWLVLFLPSLALTIRRYRDVGLRGRGFLVFLGVQIILNISIFVEIVNVFDNFDTDFNSPLYSVGILGIALINHLISIALLILTLLPSNQLTISPESNGFMKFFLRTKESELDNKVINTDSLVITTPSNAQITMSEENSSSTTDSDR
ncbi:DUF805 domain-containing protein [Ligilactobacillus equi]|uniref:DUF805 domain-containing protein n=1 Tax=Ligilactobacillus equi TaxID=137357 RepID=UPI002ED60D96